MTDSLRGTAWRWNYSLHNRSRWTGRDDALARQRKELIELVASLGLGPDAHPDLFTYTDLSIVPELDDPALWYDEIHPTENGFAFCVPPLHDALRAALPAAKRVAAG